MAEMIKKPFVVAKDTTDLSEKLMAEQGLTMQESNKDVTIPDETLLVVQEEEDAEDEPTTTTAGSNKTLLYVGLGLLAAALLIRK